MSRKQVTPDGYMSRQAERFVQFRWAGEGPKDAVRAMDKEDGRFRTDAQIAREAGDLERATRSFQANGQPVEEMSDTEFAKYESLALQKAVKLPKEFNQTALNALEKLKEMRTERKFGSFENAMETFTATTAELVRLCDPAIWGRKSGKQTGNPLVRREAEKAEGDAPSKPERNGRDPTSLTAILAVLTDFRSQEEQILKGIDKAIGQIHEARSRNQVTA